MTEVEFSRKMGVLVAYLNQAAVKRLFEAVKKSTSYETLQEPYKTWVTNPTEIPLKDLRENAKQERKARN
jgi:vacuolar-type H+-ATPase catalytic subunit A/Vma1